MKIRVHIVNMISIFTRTAVIGVSLSKPHGTVAINEIPVCIYIYNYMYLYGGQLSVYFVTLIIYTPTGCNKLNCIAIP